MKSDMKLVVPLRNVYRKTRIARGKTAMSHLRLAIARLSKTPVDSVILDPSLNRAVWARGIKKPPARISVELKKDKDKVRAFLEGHVEMPKAPEKKEEKKVEKKPEAKKESKEEKKEAKPVEKKAAPKKKEAPKEEKKAASSEKKEEKSK